MNEIKCPHCGQAFVIDEAGYSAILSQVRTNVFDKEVKKQVDAISKALKQENEIKSKEELQKKDDDIRDLLIEIEQLRSKHSNAITEAVSKKETEIAALEEQIKNIKESNELVINAEVAKITNQKDDEISGLKMQIQQLESKIELNDSAQELAVSKAVNDEKEKYEKKLTEKTEELSQSNEKLLRVEADIEKMKIENQLAIKEAVSEIENERDAQKAKYEIELKAKQTEVDYYKDLKAKMSTKMIGETLEQHCENSFNMIRSTAFRNAEFGKDNTVVDGAKGDYIYREKDEYGNEIISIMFEMKNEMDTTATKHKNEDFFAKLDKDRNNKKCEYAVLVTMLEADSELYNQGIVDVSYEYEKMYVIRPQFFIPMITILRNAALNSVKYKQELSDMKNQEKDFTDFEERIEKFKSGFSRNYELACKQFNAAIDDIDKTIKCLEKVKDDLLKSENNLRLANNKAQDQLTIKALTKGNDTMKKIFDNVDNN